MELFLLGGMVLIILFVVVVAVSTSVSAVSLDLIKEDDSEI